MPNGLFCTDNLLIAIPHVVRVDIFKATPFVGFKVEIQLIDNPKLIYLYDKEGKRFIQAMKDYYNQKEVLNAEK